jgi:hypothetical protein
MATGKNVEGLSHILGIEKFPSKIINIFFSHMYYNRNSRQLSIYLLTKSKYDWPVRRTAQLQDAKNNK